MATATIDCDSTTLSSLGRVKADWNDAWRVNRHVRRTSFSKALTKDAANVCRRTEFTTTLA